MNNSPTQEEIMIISAAKALRNNELILVGKGLPQHAATFAKLSHAPEMKIILEAGVVNPTPIGNPVGIADPRLWHGSEMFGGLLDILGMVLQRGKIDVGFLGGAEIDQFGNLNSTIVVDEFGKQRRLIGSGGANDIASLAKRTIIVMKHERRRFPSAVNYLTSPGYLEGEDSRSRAGLRGSGPDMVITDLCVFTFNKRSKRMELATLHPGVNLDQVVRNTGFPFDAHDQRTRTTEIPTSAELEILREKVMSA